jgi:hypothetical protein
MFCKQCGKEIMEQAVVCVHCGAATDKLKANRPEEEEGAVTKNTLVLGYLLAAFMPLLGGIAGIYVMAKGKAVHGLGMMALAFFAFFFWMGFFAAL